MENRFQEFINALREMAEELNMCSSFSSNKNTEETIDVLSFNQIEQQQNIKCASNKGISQTRKHK